MSLETDGFAVARGVLSPADAADLAAALEVEPSTTLSRRGSAFARRNLLDHPAARGFADGVGRGLVTPHLGHDARPVRAILFDKTPAANWTVPWHQDRSVAVAERREAAGFGPWSVKAGVVHVQPPVGVLRGMLTVRLHLDDCGGDNGPLRVVPGTHGDLLDVNEVERQSTGGVAVTAAVGDAVLMRPLLLHASSPATRPGRRRVLHVEYAAGDLPGGLRWRFG